MDIKEHIKVFLSFSKKERRGIYVLLVIALFLWILPVFFTEEGAPEDVLQITPIQISKAKNILRAVQDSSRYRRKNWQIYKPEIQNDNRFAHTSVANDGSIKKSRFYDRETKLVDLNEVDSAGLEGLPGIGERLSARIIKYRDRLGGFYDVVQLKEVYGLRDSLLALLATRVTVKDRYSVKKININRCSYADLRKHPYMSHAFAKALVAFRQTHGSIRSSEDLYSLVAVTRELTDRMIPYISFEE